MEVVEDSPAKTPLDTVDNVLASVENKKSASSLVKTENICQKSNGDAKLKNAENSNKIHAENVNKEKIVFKTEKTTGNEGGKDGLIRDKSPVDSQSDSVEIAKPNEIVTKSSKDSSDNSNKNVVVENCDQQSTNDTCKINDKGSQIEKCENPLQTTIEKVTFQTEILVESNDSEVMDSEIPNSASNILSELGHSIELSEALRASDVTDNTNENNNCSVGSQEVFNKEELLDILEGNDTDEAPSMALVINESNMQTTIIHSNTSKMREVQIAMDQLNRLKMQKKPRNRRNSKKISKEDVIEIVTDAKEVTVSGNNTVSEDLNVGEDVTIGEEVTVGDDVTITEGTKEDNIVNDLVKDWEEEDHSGDEQVNKTVDQNNINKPVEQKLNVSSSLNSSEGHQKEVKQELNSPGTTLTDQPNSKSGDENIPQRRLGRVIKKKVIFDPDNPDTFTKTKTFKPKEIQEEKDQPSLKKIKTEQISVAPQRANSKSPTSKLQWKKPTPKNSNKYKRPSEIDKLLMDEGALNMIYQLTPEAPKGKKNMKTKAEFIKKLQSSTPDSKEMKFRERKKEFKCEEGEAKKILGGKHRMSLSSSVKSPSVSEDFEAHSADDSIIYRRHSSSSYSSSCMSPRRLSDVECTVGPTNSRPSRKGSTSDSQYLNSNETVNNSSTENTFMGDSIPDISTDIINKNDCLSLKEKLNSKLALALNKRKRESGKSDKSIKQKKLVKTDVRSLKEDGNSSEYKYLSISVNDKLGEIFIKKSGSKYSLEVINELIKALTFLETRGDTSVTLLASESGTLCSGLQLNPLLDENNDTKSKFAKDIAESVRSLLHTVELHSKLICTGVEGSCWGVGLALVALSDVCMASERAVFQLSRKTTTGGNVLSLEPGVAVLTAHYRSWSQTLLNDLVIFGRQLSAVEAQQYGLVSRNVWPEGFLEQIRSISKDLARLPAQNLLLKKKLLKINSGSQSTFLSCLEEERNLLAQYWLSAEGQHLLREYVADSE